jgi:hypothetical protein
MLSGLLAVLFAAALMARRPTVPLNPGLHWRQYR